MRHWCEHNAECQLQGPALGTPTIGKTVITLVAVDLQNALEARQDVHRMAAMTTGRIGEDDGGRIAATPPTIIAGLEPA